MKDIHIIMQGKGGVGKTLISFVMAQYFGMKERRVLCIDTDPINKSFFRFKALNTISVPLLKDGEIEQTAFDFVSEKFFADEGESDCIIVDSGASSFVPLNKYIIDCGLLDMLNERGTARVWLHSVIVGGQGAADTLTGLAGLLGNYLQAQCPPKICVWLNPFLGALEWKGKTFTETQIYENHKDFITCVIEMPRFSPQLYGKDLEQLLSSGQTFEEAQHDSSLTLMAKHRLHMVQKQFFETLDKVGIG